MTVAQLGISVDSSQVKSATTALNQFNQASSSAAKGADNLAQAGQKSATNIGAIDAAAKRAGISTKEMQARVDAASASHTKMAAASQTAVKGIQQLSVQASKTANDNKVLGEQTEKTTGSLEKFATRFTRGLIAGAAIAAVQQFTKYLFDLNAQIAATADTAQRVAVGGQQFQGLQTAAGFKGIGNSDFNAAMIGFNQQIDLAKHGLGDLRTLLASNGKAVSSTSETLGTVADLVQRATGDYARQVSILQQAGLPATQQWVQLFEQGGAAINKIAQSSSKLTDQQLQDAKKLNDQWNEIWTNFENWGKRAVVNISSAFKGLTFSPLDSVGRSMLKQGQGSQLSQGQADQFYNAVGISSPTRVPVTGGTPSSAPFDPALVKQQISLEQQRLSILGPLATVEDQVRAKQLELNAAALNNVGISKAQQQALLDVTRAQAEMARVQQQASIGVFDFAKAQQAANDNLKALVAQKLLDPNNAEQWAAAINNSAKAVENLANQAKVAGAPLEGLQRLANEAGSARTQVDQFATSSLNSLSDSLVSVANGSMSAADGFRNFGLAVVTALQKMIIQLVIIAPLAKALQGFFGFGLFSDGGYVDPGSSSNPLAGLTSADYGPGFAVGGYTGAGGKYQPAGIVHAGEYVFDAVSTSRIGVRNLDAMRSVVRGYDVGGFVTAPATPSFGGNVVAGPWGQQDNAAPSFTYAPNIDARGADAAAVARLASVMAKDKRDFEKNVQSVMIKYRANNPGANR